MTVNSSTDLPNLYPGGQTVSAGATTGDLRYVLNYILNEQAQGTAQDYDIVFAPGIQLIQLNARLSALNLLGSDTIVIGNADPASPVTLSGTAGTGGLFIRSGAVTLRNLNFQNLNVTGGSGNDGGGGGMGAGGALFIDTANVILHNVTFTNCSATAGLGGNISGSGGGGGGLGGNGGSNAGGGGGLGGNGGSNHGGGGGAGGDGGGTLGGGGGPILGSAGGTGGPGPIDAVSIAAYTFGGVPISPPFALGGGGYGSASNVVGGTGAGGNNSGGLGGFDGDINVGGDGGNGGSPQLGSGAGASGNNSPTAQANAGGIGMLGGQGGLGGVYYVGISGLGGGGGGGGGYSGGGGGGGSGNMSGGGGGGGGGLGGGGGGGFNPGPSGGSGILCGGSGGHSSVAGGGGGGGCGGGGGGGGFAFDGMGNGGNGGDGGGGGGSHAGGVGGYGAGGGNGNGGGFAGGGGAGSGSGGFGGGGGESGTGGFGGGGGRNGVGGTGAASGVAGSGGDAAALGGAVFLGSANGQPTLTITGNSTTALNSTSNNSGSGFAGGDDFFLYSGTTLNLAPGAGETITISKSVIDDSVQSIPAAPDWAAGVGSGANLQVTGAGTVALGGTNSYIGSTTISSGTLNLSGTLYAGGAGPGSQITVSVGAILKGTGTINAPTTVLGTLSPGNAIGTLYANAPLNSPGTMVFGITPTTGNNTQLSSTSTVDVTGSTIQIDPASGTYVAGAEYTLLTSAGLTGTASLTLPAQFAGTLTYPNNSIVLRLSSVPTCVRSAFALEKVPATFLHAFFGAARN